MGQKLSHISLLFLIVVLPTTNVHGYDGDGVLDSGLIRCPTFRVIFPGIPLEDGAKARYRAKGVPDFELILRLVLHRRDRMAFLPWEEGLEVFKNLEKANTSITVQLFENGREIRSSGPDVISETWIFAAYVDISYLWHRRFNHLKLDSEAVYELAFKIETESPVPEHFRLIPMLEGGGWFETYRPPPPRLK